MCGSLRIDEGGICVCVCLRVHAHMCVGGVGGVVWVLCTSVLCVWCVGGYYRVGVYKCNGVHVYPICIYTEY